MTILQSFEAMRFLPTSLSFLFVALPVMLLAFYLAPKRFRLVVLLAESLGCYFLADPNRLPLLLVSVAVSYAALRLMELRDKFPKHRLWCFATAMCVNLALIVWCGVTSRMSSTPLTLGVQVYSLSAISALWDVYRREIPYNRNIVSFALYIAFFPRLCAGPMLPYGDFAGQLHGITMQPGDVMSGWGQYIQGAFKAAVFGGQLHALHRSAVGIASPTVLSSWLGVFALAFALYFTLSGFDDIARGIGTMFGLKLPKNFYYPYQSRGMEDFFERFNITVNGFLRDTVYASLRGSSQSRRIDAMSILVTGAAAGLWFGLRPNYALWGAFLALFIVLERYAFPAVVEHTPTLFRRAATLAIVLVSFTIFATDSLPQSALLIRSMFDFRSLANDPALYLLSSNWLLLVCGCFFATNIVSLAVTKFRRAFPVPAGLLFGALDVAILVVYTALSL